MSWEIVRGGGSSDWKGRPSTADSLADDLYVQNTGHDDQVDRRHEPVDSGMSVQFVYDFVHKHGHLELHSVRETQLVEVAYSICDVIVRDTSCNQASRAAAFVAN